MRHGFCLFLLVLLLSATTLGAATSLNHFATATPLAMSVYSHMYLESTGDYWGSTAPTVSKALLGYDFSASYMGYFWHTGDSASIQGKPVGISNRIYSAQRYQPAGETNREGTVSADFSAGKWKNLGLNAQIDIIARNSNWDYFYGNYRFSFGASMRQSILDNLFVYENFGPTFRFDATRFGVYADAGVAYIPIWGLTVTGGMKAFLDFSSDWLPAFDWVTYVGVGYGF